MLHLLLSWAAGEEKKHEILSICIKHRLQSQCCFNAVDLLAQLSVDGQDLGVADESEGQDGDGVCGLWDRECCFSVF